jgi:ubiquitin carboxyl-terminal hydrolase 25/28
MTPLTTSNDEALVKEENEKLKIVKDCLNGWISQIEGKMNELKSDIDSLNQKINTIYEDENLKRLKYNLHSVCIHEGNATSGHFWTYIWNTQQLKWFKFNDTDVSESSWDDLYANAVGGGNKTSYSDENTSIKSEPKSETSTSKNTDNLNSNSSNVNKLISNDRSAYFLVYTSAQDPNLYQGTYLL